jgi:hypothetical protein
MNKHIFLLASAFFLTFTSSAQEGYPTPPDGKNRLFYVQRTGNTNTIMYDANVSDSKTFKDVEPVNVYWLRYADGGGAQGLSYIQRSLAYGMKSKKIAGTNDCEIHFVSYAKKKMRLAFDDKGAPYALVEVNGRKMKLSRVFVKIDKSTTFTLTPKVEYVEFWGKDPNSGAAVYEKFIP